jgi:hypothetical protein
MFNLNVLSIDAAQERAADLVRAAERERRLARVDPPLTDQLVRRVRVLTRWRPRRPQPFGRPVRPVRSTPGCA